MSTKILKKEQLSAYTARLTVDLRNLLQRSKKKSRKLLGKKFVKHHNELKTNNWIR